MSLPESSLISVAFSVIPLNYILFLRTLKFQKKIQEEKRKDERKKDNVLRARGVGEGVQGPCISSNNEHTINTFVKPMVS